MAPPLTPKMSLRTLANFMLASSSVFWMRVPDPCSTRQKTTQPGDRGLSKLVADFASATKLLSIRRNLHQTRVGVCGTARFRVMAWGWARRTKETGKDFVHPGVVTALSPQRSSPSLPPCRREGSGRANRVLRGRALVMGEVAVKKATSPQGSELHSIGQVPSAKALPEIARSTSKDLILQESTLLCRIDQN
jgi:hypothetical protein